MAGDLARAALEKAPPVDCQLYWDAFFDINTMRPVGMGIGQIPIDKIVWYSREWLHLPAHEERALVAVIMAMDRKFMELYTPKAK